jgi:hypothetical protein
MKALEQVPDFGMEFFDVEVDFDIHAAFQDAMDGVVTDTELALEEKVRRMEVIVTESNSEVYRDFVDFRSIASQMEMFCSHDHLLREATQSNETLSGFMDSHKADDGHNHSDQNHDKSNQKVDDDADDIDPRTGKKKKKRSYGWFLLAQK